MTEWIKASASYGHGDCLELCRRGENVQLRDSKHPNEVRDITVEMLADLMDGVKRGEFDRLLESS